MNTEQHPSIEAWKNLQKDIAETCEDYNRSIENIQLIAVSKTVPADNIFPLLQAGQRLFAENRVQEAAEKWPYLRQQFEKLNSTSSVLCNPIKQQKLLKSLMSFKQLTAKK